MSLYYALEDRFVETQRQKKEVLTLREKNGILDKNQGQFCLIK